ncbi:MAG TPA: ParB/RepB/Spo0J family partition protein [Hellea balneolensis]|uniref:ParB/RepB/Spo0J family partition protein n=1 Tax=Hellea balneolensis TaxID=287478 RepID=A0A7C5LZZ8_9PROT|nr:ParB/RepB/Spo0J family partition protein [Hellea balneolensis]
MSKKPTRGLGRGLSALMDDIAPVSPAKTNTKAQPNAGGVELIPTDKIVRNPDQPRRHFDKQKLEELTASVRDKGVLQPILVRPVQAKSGTEVYQIVAGERRWHAAMRAGIEHMPVLVRELSDREVLEIGVVENVQRADLNPLEEALAYKALIDQFGRKPGEIASAIGKSRAHVANMIRLLGLPERARTLLAEGKITAGHARAILAAPDPQSLTDAILRDALSVRAAEKWVRTALKAAQNPAQKKDKHRAIDADTRFVEKQLSDHLGLKVELNHKSPGGTLTIRYKTLDELEDLTKRLRSS